ncbi:MAG: DUF4012 domain-containing protein [Candidatus Buchananbacteria bacterium]|jgi:hypothetical protein
MKVTKKKTARQQRFAKQCGQAKRSVKASSGKLSAYLPSQLKKTLEKSRGAGLVLFEENDHGKWEERNREQEVAIAAKDAGKIFNIRLAESSLDVYRSPHLMDLSGYHRVSNIMHSDVQKEFSYEDMPGGKFLSKYHILDFWDFRKSEIVIGVNKYYSRFKAVYASIFDQPEFAPLLRGEREAKAAQSRLEEVTLVGIVLFFADFYYKIYLSIYKSILISKLLLKETFKKDETVYLQKDKPQSAPQMAALMDRLIAASHEPTISELLKPAVGTDHIAQKEVSSGKFKIINYSPNRKKEVQEKYLADNFTRKGVVVNPQKHASLWPKDSLSWDIGSFAFSAGVLKPVAVFIGILIALTSSVKVASYWEEIHDVKGKVMGEAEQAMTNIDSAAGDIKSMDFNAAREKFSAANSNFVSAQGQLDEIKSFLTTLAEIAPAENTFKSGTNIIDMGEHLSNAAGLMLSGVSEADNSSDLSLASRVKNLSLALTPALLELKAAELNSNNIGISNLPAEQKDKFLKLKSALPEAIKSLKSLIDTSAFAVNVLGDNDVRRYLLVFQNDNELRATGGFMGSFALVDLRGGKIDKITIPEGGTYDVRAGFNQVVASPDPLRLVTDRWEFQDSNWWPDFPTSAKNIKWFYEKSGGPTIDGVIAVNSSFFGKLLSLTGPINLPAYGKTIMVENFEEELQKSIELEAKEKTKPKKILGELAPLMMDKLLNADPKQLFNLAEAMSGGLKRRDIQMYFTDTELQKFTQARNWAGELSSPIGSDFLSVNTANIGGGKTDSVIRQKIYHSAEIQSDGTVLDKVLIERRNIGPTDEIFTTVANNSYVRVYVPEGSVLVHAEGFKGFADDKFKKPADNSAQNEGLAAENNALIDADSGTRIYNENGKTVFANWSIAGPGEMRELLLVYKLPFRVSFSSGPKSIIEKAADLFSSETAAYSWKFQKQSGRDSDEISSSVSYPSNLNLKLSYPESAAVSLGQVLFSGKTDADKFLIAGFSKN